MAPQYLIRDPGSICRAEVLRCLASFNIEEIVRASRSPWQWPAWNS
jgi:hypothetical protein